MEKKRCLYKFRPDNENTLKLLREQRLHFSHPFDFNDPFDCRPTFVKFDIEQIILKHSLQQNTPYQTLVYQNLHTLKDQVFPHAEREALEREVLEIFNSMYILSMSYNCDSPIMWAHYAKEHTGVCLAFDSTLGSTYLNDAQTDIVRYVDKNSSIDLDNVETYQEQILNILFQKYNGWIYEDEYRIVKTPQQMNVNGEKQNSFEKSALVAIFFGLHMSEERINFYKLQCKKYGYDNLQYFKMTLPTDGSYFLVPKEC